MFCKTLTKTVLSVNFSIYLSALCPTHSIEIDFAARYSLQFVRIWNQQFIGTLVFLGEYLNRADIVPSIFQAKCLYIHSQNNLDEYFNFCLFALFFSFSLIFILATVQCHKQKVQENVPWTTHSIHYFLPLMPVTENQSTFVLVKPLLGCSKLQCDSITLVTGL